MVSTSASWLRAIGVVLILVQANLASAQVALNEPERSITVHYDDLNLSSADGSRVLYRRLVQAAKQLCPKRADTVLALRLNRNADNCVAQTVERAVRQIEHPRFVEVAAARGW